MYNVGIRIRIVYEFGINSMIFSLCRTVLVTLFVILISNLKPNLGFASGHSKAVRDISFNNPGTQFLSAAYDRYVKLWDTETGITCTVLSKYTV